MVSCFTKQVIIWILDVSWEKYVLLISWFREDLRYMGRFLVLVSVTKELSDFGNQGMVSRRALLMSDLVGHLTKPLNLDKDQLYR
jgi:hypothetical protein